jgi:hypothetical protein
MGHKISIKKGENFVHSYVLGPISWELLAKLMTKTAEKGEKWGFNRYLSDLRGAEKQMRIYQDFEFAQRQAREYGLKPGVSKHALIVRHEEIAEYSFVETAFRNAGYRLKIFTEEDAAFDWIRE